MDPTLRWSEKLPRSRVIRRRDVFTRVREKGLRKTNKYFLLNFLYRPADIVKDTSRSEVVAFITPKKIGPAHVRNRVRRQMREVFRRSPYYLKGEHKYFLVWVARNTVVDLEFTAISQAMIELLEKLR